MGVGRSEGEITLTFRKAQKPSLAMWRWWHDESGRKGKFKEEGGDDRHEINLWARKVWGCYLQSQGTYYWSLAHPKRKIDGKRKIFYRYCVVCEHEIVTGETAVHPALWDLEKDKPAGPNLSEAVHVGCLTPDDWHRILGCPRSGSAIRDNKGPKLNEETLRLLDDRGQLTLFDGHTVESAARVLREMKGLEP